MTAREDPWIGQPTKIEAARLDATVHLSAADHELISISRDFVPMDGSPRRRPRPHVREERRVAVEEKDQIKMRLGRSPDLADAYMQTHAIPDMPADMMQQKPAAALQPRGGRAC